MAESAVTGHACGTDCSESLFCNFAKIFTIFGTLFCQFRFSLLFCNVFGVLRFRTRLSNPTDYLDSRHSFDN